VELVDQAGGEKVVPEAAAAEHEHVAAGLLLA
jgi:hypothetical protein